MNRRPCPNSSVLPLHSELDQDPEDDSGEDQSGNDHEEDDGGFPGDASHLMAADGFIDDGDAGAEGERQQMPMIPGAGERLNEGGVSEQKQHGGHCASSAGGSVRVAREAGSMGARR